MSIVNYSGVFTYNDLTEIYETGRDCNRRINYLLLTEILKEEDDTTGNEFYLVTVFKRVLREDVVVSKVFLQEVIKN